MEATTNKASTSEHANPTIADSIADLGAAWARYGLRMGSAALESQSKNLEECGKALGDALATSAKTLARLADSFDKKAQRPGDDAVEVTAAAHDDPLG